MEIDITAFMANEDAYEFSGSIAERGPNAGPQTWANAKECAARAPLLATPEQIEEARDYFKEFGAWDDETRAAWSAEEVNALLIQYISGNLREIESLCSDDDGEIDWVQVEAQSSEGRIAGDIYPSAHEDGTTHYYFMMEH